MSYPSKRRRTATSVLAGNFDPRPTRDVLTSLLNGVPMPKPTEEEIQARRERKKERRERHEREKEKERVEREKAREKHDKKRVKTTHKSADIPPPLPLPAALVPDKPKHAPPPVARAPQPSSFWQARPQIVIPSLQRSASFSPPPMPQSSPPTTPGPSISSRTSATSSKRPYTPDDFDELTDRQQSVESQTPTVKKERKKRVAARKGWKGWVEGSPPPSEKLINLDVATILPERRTRSGKTFDPFV